MQTQLIIIRTVQLRGIMPKVNIWPNGVSVNKRIKITAASTPIGNILNFNVLEEIRDLADISDRLCKTSPKLKIAKVVAYAEFKEALTEMPNPMREKMVSKITGAEIVKRFFISIKREEILSDKSPFFSNANRVGNKLNKTTLKNRIEAVGIGGVLKMKEPIVRRISSKIPKPKIRPMPFLTTSVILKLSFTPEKIEENLLSFKIISAE